MSQDQRSQTPDNRPSVCRNCGAIVAAGEPTCPMCGSAISGGQQPRPGNVHPGVDHETLRFAQALFSRPYLFTIAFIVTNLFIFFLMWEQSGRGTEVLLSFDSLTLVRFGAKVNRLIDQGQWWRFVTPVFVHGGILHVLVNMYGLWMLGPYVERLYGSARFVVIWVVSGVAGVFASYLTVRPSLSHGLLGGFLFKANDVPSVGASGALFGLIGVLFVFGLKYRHELPEGFKRAFGTGMLPTILLNVFIGLSVRFIDNAAHMGGLVAGALLAFVIDYKRLGPRAPVTYFWHVLQVLCLALVVLSFGMVVKHYSDPVEQYLPEIVAESSSSNVSGYLNALNKGNAAMIAASDGDDSSVDAAIAELDSSPDLDPTATALKNELKSMLIRVKPIAARIRQVQVEKGGGAPLDSATRRELEKLADDYQHWIDKRGAWVKNEGKTYGVVLETKPQSPSPQSK